MEAVKVAYKPKDDNVAASMGSQLLNNPKVLSILNGHEAQAEQVVVDVLTGTHTMDKDKIAAAKLLLAYTRGNPVSRNENINVNVTLEDILAS